jgi:hypothetical protein
VNRPLDCCRVDAVCQLTLADAQLSHDSCAAQGLMRSSWLGSVPARLPHIRTEYTTPSRSATAASISPFRFRLRHCRDHHYTMPDLPSSSCIDPSLPHPSMGYGASATSAAPSSNGQIESLHFPMTVVWFYIM